MKLEEYLQKKYSKSTLNSNLYNIKRFTDYMNGSAETDKGGSTTEKSQKATYQDVLHFIEYLRKNYDLHSKTLRHCLYGVKIYFNNLLEIGKRKDHPCRELYLKDKINRQSTVPKHWKTSLKRTKSNEKSNLKQGTKSSLAY